MIEKNVPDNVVEHFLQNNESDPKGRAIKWFLILSGIGAGLTIITFFLPVGIHSIAIMVFSIAFSFLAYFYYLKQSGK